MDIITCSPCLENITRNESCIALKCGHRFHKDCMQQWLRNYARFCPNCRKEVSGKTEIKT